MDLLKYLEPMKNLPKRFSNLAFWRDVRKFKDEVVNAFEYVDSWGTHIETLLPSGDYVESNSLDLPSGTFKLFDYSTSLLTVSTNSSGITTIVPMLSLVGSPCDLDLSTDKTSVVVGKHIDCILVTYLTTDKISVTFSLPNGHFESVFFNGRYVNGYTISQCACFGREVEVNSDMLANYQNLTFNKITIYYH